jgi:hypothetical protein
VRKLLFLLLLLPIFAWAADPFDGIWKINVNQATASQNEDAVVVLQNGTFQCISCNPKINIKADGTDQAVSPETKDYDMMAIKAVDEKSTETTSKKGGRLVSKTKNIISADGKTSTIEITNYPEPGKQPFTYRLTYMRVAEGPPGSHAISGTWRMQNLNAALTMTIKSTPDGLVNSGPAGQSFEAKFDGKDYPLKGASPGMTVSLKRVNERTIDSTVKQNGKIVQVSHMTVSADGKTITIASENKEQGTTATFTGVKQ